MIHQGARLAGCRMDWALVSCHFGQNIWQAFYHSRSWSSSRLCPTTKGFQADMILWMNSAELHLEELVNKGECEHSLLGRRFYFCDLLCLKEQRYSIQRRALVSKQREIVYEILVIKLQYVGRNIFKVLILVKLPFLTFE